MKTEIKEHQHTYIEMYRKEADATYLKRQQCVVVHPVSWKVITLYKPDNIF